MRNELGQVGPVVIGFMRRTVGEVSRAQLGLPIQEIVDASQPKGFQVAQVSDVLLNGPGAIEPPRQDGMIQAGGPLLSARRCAAKSFNDEGEMIGWR